MAAVAITNCKHLARPYCTAAFANYIRVSRSRWCFKSSSAGCDLRDIRQAPRASRPEVLSRKRPKEKRHVGFYNQNHDCEARQLPQDGCYAGVPRDGRKRLRASQGSFREDEPRSEERRVGKECRSPWA